MKSILNILGFILRFEEIFLKSEAKIIKEKIWNLNKENEEE